jgi:hypothetical protein
MWCKKHGFRYADKLIPQEWFEEPTVPARLQAIHQFEKE